MDARDFRRLVEEARKAIANPRRSRDIPAPGATEAPAQPRFELYHAGPSLCSHKVRFTLAEKGLAFRAHAMSLPAQKKRAPECYRPEYVRLRLLGAPEAGLVTGYTGRSSVETEGFDPAVVPTLVDHEARRVVVDSVRICDYVDREAGTGPPLRPEELSDEIDALIAIVDRAPHVALLYGQNPDGDFRPSLFAKVIEGVHARKEVGLRAMMELVPDEPDLLAAYEAKIAKERAAAEFIANRDSMATIVGQMRDGVVELEERLEKHGGEWAAGDRFTLADTVWGPSLFRMQWVGIGHLFAPGSECPRVATYAERLLARPAFQSMVQWWPGAQAPSPHVPGMDSLAYKARFLWLLLRGMV